MATKAKVPEPAPVQVHADDDRLPLKPAAAFIGMSEIFLRRLALSGRIRHFKVGTRLQFAVRDLRAYLAECERPAVKP